MQVGEEQEITIEEFFLMCEQGGTYQIDTPLGWKNIPYLVKKKNKECYNLVLQNGVDLGCSSDHYILVQKEGDHSRWVSVEDLDIESDVVDTKNGMEIAVAKEYLGVRDTYDLGVDDKNHSYYTNGITSHNTGKSATCDALADLYQMPLLRLDFGAIFASHVGESEANIRQCLQLAESIAPCVEGSSRVNVNGVSLKVESLFSKEESDPKNQVTESQNELQKVVYISSGTMTVEGVDKDGLSKKLKVKALIRNKKQERLIRIKTKSGKEIVTTQDHLLMAGDKKMKKSKDFTQGEVIYTVDNNSIQGDIACEGLQQI